MVRNTGFHPVNGGPIPPGDTKIFFIYMQGNKISAIEWLDLIDGTTLQMKDFPSIRLLKLDNNKACYFGYGNETKIVDVKEHESEKHGSYYYFQTEKDDWHPLTTRLWNI